MTETIITGVALFVADIIGALINLWAKLARGWAS